MRETNRSPIKNVSVVRGFAVLDRHSVPVVLQIFGEEEELGALHIEKMLYASLDRLDEKMVEHNRGENDDQGDSNGNHAGLYLGRLASVGQYTVYGFVTSTSKRILLSVREDQAREKIGDITMCDILTDIGEAYVDHVANPFVAESAASTDAFSAQVTEIIKKHLGEGG